ncbi:hypothetical protein [Mycolicibacterium elephantis]|uniref:hypothetical protein n=1 Tax=Mycolicibacterium elephantis TaxID=81858 RepID=UPI0007E9837A|nr:hypothetical protein [Mycolicibacterium elephantis]OBB20615.1 hypothetical protein A5762_15275 [Mycolicibacterium elephantis]
MSEMVRATEAFIYRRNGVAVTVRPGDLLPSDDPAVKGRQHRFEPEAATPAVTKSRKRRFEPVETAAPAAEPSPDDPSSVDSYSADNE